MTENIETSKYTSNPKNQKNEISEVINNTQLETHTLWQKIKEAMEKLADGKILEALSTLFTNTKTNSSPQKPEESEQSPSPEQSNQKETNNSTDSDKDSKNQDEKPENPEEEKLQDGLDKEKKTYTNPKSGLTYKRIDQVLDPAGKLKYPGGKKTVASIWCLLASGCTITSAFSPSVTLEDCFKTVRHWTAGKDVPKMSDNKQKSEALLKGEHGNRTKAECKKAQEKIEENCEKWYPAIVACRRKGIDGVNTSIVSQHYMSILDMRTNGGKKEFFVGNTYKNWHW